MSNSDKVTVSIAQLAEGIQAEVLCCPESTGKLVENVMIGTMTYGSGAEYFARKENKAVIAPGDRSDMAMAALSTSTVCLILSNGKGTIPQVMHMAEEKGVTVLSAKQGVIEIADEIDKIFGGGGSDQQETEESEQVAE